MSYETILRKSLESSNEIDKLGKKMLEFLGQEKEVEKMIDIETRAVNTHKLLSDFMGEILASGKFQYIYSEDVGNLEKCLIDNKNYLEINLKDYKEKEDLNKRFSGAYEAEYKKSLHRIGYHIK